MSQMINFQKQVVITVTRVRVENGNIGFDPDLSFGLMTLTNHSTVSIRQYATFNRSNKHRHSV